MGYIMSFLLLFNVYCLSIATVAVSYTHLTLPTT